MNFSYFKITSQVSRPIIPLILISDTNFIIYQGLIDSGADNCIFNMEVAEKLGLNFKNKNSIEFVGVNGEAVRGFLGEVRFKIEDKTYLTNVIFAEISDFGHGILGQKGFFDHFDVKLSYQQQLIEIETVNNP